MERPCLSAIYLAHGHLKPGRPIFLPRNSSVCSRHSTKVSLTLDISTYRKSGFSLYRSAPEGVRLLSDDDSVSLQCPPLFAFSRLLALVLRRQSRPHSPKCTLFSPFRGPTIGAHHSPPTCASKMSQMTSSEIQTLGPTIILHARESGSKLLAKRFKGELLRDDARHGAAALEQRVLRLAALWEIGGVERQKFWLETDRRRGRVTLLLSRLYSHNPTFSRYRLRGANPQFIWSAQ